MRLLALLLLFVFSLPAADAKFEFWPGAVYDSKVPTFRQVLGYDPGEKISSHAELVRYMEALAAYSKQVKLVDYGKTWEGRRLFYAVVGSEANMRRLDEIRAAMQRLADPRKTTDAEAKRLIASLPAVLWLAYGVHGNEISSPDAALLTAYHLLASQDKMTQDLLAGALVILVPSQNPDGRDRFVNNFQQASGLEADASPVAAEHQEPWPGGRSNHYLFDMNRDWIALTQPEIAHQVKALLDWYPLVYVDLHEMGSESTYYFAPEAVPYNPHLTKDQKESLEWFGRNNARWFDQRGFDYFTREVFDAFYPGYGASWPCYHGAIAMTYEQASSRGLLMRRSDETVFHFRDTVKQHFTASISTIETGAKRRADLLERFWTYRKSAVEEGSKEAVREFILPRQGDTAAVDKLAALLGEHGIELKRATAPFKSAGREFPAGSYVVPLAQPAKRMARVLLDAQVSMDEPFLKEQERLRKKNLPDEIYDVTAWSLPLAFNVECVAAAEVSQGGFEPVAKLPRIVPGKVTPKTNAVAYLVPWGTQAAGRFLAGALRRDLRILSADKSFTQGGRKYPAGTLVVKTAGNPSNLVQTLEKLARTTGAEIVATDSGWVEEGINFGSNRTVRLRKPNVALAWDRPTSSSSAGWARFVLERQFGYPVTIVRAATLPMADLRRFDVIILPDGSGDFGFGANGARRLKDWVAAGGTLVAIDGAVAYLAGPSVGLLDIKQEYAVKPEAGKKSEGAKPAAGAKPEAAKPEAAKPEPGGGAGAPGSARVPGKLLASEEDYEKAIQGENELPDAVVGVIAKAKLDPDHWLTAGMDGTVNALASGRAIYTPVTLDKGVNAAVYLGPDQVLVSGYLWEENRKQLAYKPLAIVQEEGRGQVIAFTADPNFRAMLDGMNLLFVNAVLRGPGRTSSAAAE